MTKTIVNLDSKTDVLVMTCDCPDESSIQKIEEALDSVKREKNLGIILVFNEEDSIEDMKMNLEKRSEDEVKRIYFTKAKSTREGGYENALFPALAAGKVFSPPIGTLNGDISSSLKKVVSKLGSVKPRVAVLFMAKHIPVCLVHDDQTGRVDYFVSGDEDYKKMEVLIRNEKNEFVESEAEDKASSREVTDESGKKPKYGWR